MNQLSQVHIDFLQSCAADSGHTRKAPDAITRAELDLMVSEGLLIAYNRASHMEYAITDNGIKVSRQFGPTKDIIQIAVKYAMTKGLSKEEAEEAVKIHGVESILNTKAAEDKGDSSGQREVTIKMDANGHHSINPKKSF